MTDKLFEIATRQKFRFPSVKGDLTTEQLWDLPLKKDNGFDLDSVARAIFKELKAADEESFVEVSKDTGQDILEQKLELVKYIIAVKQDEKKKAASRAAMAAERQRLLEVMAKREDEERASMSKEEAEKKLNDLEKQMSDLS